MADQTFLPEFPEIGQSIWIRTLQEPDSKDDPWWPTRVTGRFMFPDGVCYIYLEAGFGNYYLEYAPGRFPNWTLMERKKIASVDRIEIRQ